MASGQEVTPRPGCRMVEGQRMPLELLDDLPGIDVRCGWPTDTSRAVASLWLGQPPDLPVLVNTSQMPFSS